MTVTVEFHFDFGSPNTYNSHKLIPDIERRTGARFTYIPVLLGGIFKLTNNISPIVQYATVRNKLEYFQKEMERFRAEHGLVNFRQNSHFPINTVQIMRGAVVADMEGFLPAYFDCIDNGMWEKDLKLDDTNVIRDTLDSAGLDGAHILARIQDQDVKDALIANTTRSVEMGAFGCPTFFVGDEMYFGKDRLDAVEQEILRRLPA